MASPATLAKRKRPRVSCCHRHVHDDFFIYLAKSRSQAEAKFRAFRARWRREYGGIVWRLERYLPELLSFLAFPPHLWQKLLPLTWSSAVS